MYYLPPDARNKAGEIPNPWTWENFGKAINPDVSVQPYEWTESPFTLENINKALHPEINIRGAQWAPLQLPWWIWAGAAVGALYVLGPIKKNWIG